MLKPVISDMQATISSEHCTGESPFPMLSTIAATSGWDKSAQPENFSRSIGRLFFKYSISLSLKAKHMFCVLQSTDYRAWCRRLGMIMRKKILPVERKAL
jgi:hypothetical protein